jgi:hypothetical protein
MGLKFSDALRLSWSNIAQHKKRSAVIVLTISVLFGMIMAFNFMLQGLRGTILDAALQANDGKVYLETWYQSIVEFGSGEVEKADSIEDLEVFIKEGVERCHGRIIGEKLVYQFMDILETITPEVAESISGEIDLSNVPEDKVAVLMPAGTSQYATVNSGDYYVAGTYPATQQGSPTLPGLNPANLLLGMVYGSGFDAKSLIIDNGSEALHKYFIKIAQQKIDSGSQYTSAEEYLEAQVPQTHYIVEFPSYTDAVNYYYDNYSGENIPKNVEIGGEKYELVNMDTFGRVIYLRLDFDNLQFKLNMVEKLFIIIAVLIAAFTFAHLIDSDAATVALYRSFGASTGDIYLIYFLYLVELCLLAGLSCILIAFIIVGIMWLGNAGALAERLKEFYMLKELPKVNLFGFNDMFFDIVGSIMLVAPISLLLTVRCFSAKHIAKKLKED